MRLVKQLTTELLRSKKMKTKKEKKNGINSVVRTRWEQVENRVNDFIGVLVKR